MTENTQAPVTEEKTAEQLAAEAQAKAEAEAKAAQKAAEREAAKAQKAQEREAAKAQKAAAKEAEKAAKEEAKAAKLAEKEAKKKAAEEAKAASKQPEQNGVRRPRPETLCGKAWAVADDLSMKQGSPVAISTLLATTNPMGLNEGNVKAEYARWRKFNGVTGRVMSPEAVAKKEAAAAAKAAEPTPQPPAA